MYTFVCVCPSLVPRLGDACACVVVVRFASGGTLQVDRRLLNYASTDLYKRSAQHLQEDAGWDDAWEASPTAPVEGFFANGTSLVHTLLGNSACCFAEGCVVHCDLRFHPACLIFVLFFVCSSLLKEAYRFRRFVEAV